MTTTPTPDPKPCPLSEFPATCPHCGAAKAPGWVKGFHGWTCGSYSQAHHSGYCQEPLNIIQSIECAVTHWRRRAERAESKLDALLTGSHFEIRDGTKRRVFDDHDEPSD